MEKEAEEEKEDIALENKGEKKERRLNQSPKDRAKAKTRAQRCHIHRRVV